MWLSEKKKTFSDFLSESLKFTLSFEHFQKNDAHSWCIFEIRDSKNMVKQMSKKSRFREPFDKEKGKGTKHCSNLNHTTFNIFIDQC